MAVLLVISVKAATNKQMRNTITHGGNPLNTENWSPIKEERPDACSQTKYNKGYILSQHTSFIVEMHNYECCKQEQKLVSK